jgi:hypothetical protein
MFKLLCTLEEMEGEKLFYYTRKIFPTHNDLETEKAIKKRATTSGKNVLAK